jgi:hypothetical protein
MNFLANVDALIIDLRTNGGGDPRMVAFISTYLFAEPTHLNDLWTRSTDTTQQYWTLPYVLALHSNRYSVPADWIGRRVEVRETKNKISSGLCDIATLDRHPIIYRPPRLKVTILRQGRDCRLAARRASPLQARSVKVNG